MIRVGSKLISIIKNNFEMLLKKTGTFIELKIMNGNMWMLKRFVNFFFSFNHSTIDKKLEKLIVKYKKS